jgi:uncharacterized membrane protein YeaQ/YmgE (transglycosylase-associated protein family)
MLLMYPHEDGEFRARLALSLPGKISAMTLTLPFVVWWLIIGLIVGLIAKFIVGTGPGGIVGDIIVGILGAVVGGWLFRNLFHIAYGGFWGSLVVASSVPSCCSISYAWFPAGEGLDTDGPIVVPAPAGLVRCLPGKAT